MKVRLYTIPGSHPGMSARLMLERKGLDYQRVDLMPVISKGVLRARRFPAATVPAIEIDGRRVQGSIEIARELDRIRPEPPLYPSEAGERASVEEAERFGDAELQHPIRQIIWWGLKQDASPMRSYLAGARLGIPIGLAVRTAAPIVALAARFNEASDENVRRDLAALPGLLDRVDGFIESGAVGGPEPNAADFQIASSLALAMTMDDLRPLIESRPSGGLVKRVVPSFPGEMPPVLPPEWLAPLAT